MQRLREGPVAEHLRFEAESAARAEGGEADGASAAAAAAAASLEVAVRGGLCDGDAARAGGGVDGGGSVGRWPSLAAAEAEHILACLSSIGGYQEVGVYKSRAL